MERNEVIIILAEALQFEEVIVTPRLQTFLYKLRRSNIDERVKSEIEKRVIDIIDETANHAIILTGLLRKVAGGSQPEY